MGLSIEQINKIVAQYAAKAKEFEAKKKQHRYDPIEQKVIYPDYWEATLSLLGYMMPFCLTPVLMFIHHTYYLFVRLTKQKHKPSTSRRTTNQQR